MPAAERFWTSRLLWRLRAAPLWPSFAVLTVADGLLLHWLPPIRTGVAIVPGLLMATFGNLFLVGVISPWLSRRLARRGQTPNEVLNERTGTALLAAGLAGVLVSGLATRPLVVSETEATQRAAEAIHHIVQHSGNPELIRNEETANSVRLSNGTFRICIAHDDRRRFYCFFVDPRRRPTKVSRDRSEEPNSKLFPNGTER
ncbi:MAG: hypothetical protein LC792_20050 [Actinobacteria bacterium]|nr:hypothetical protein [Actinomycetota bacterium]